MIDEKLAENAHNMNCFGDYEEGSATKEYNEYINRFNSRVEELLEEYKDNVTDEKMGAVEYYKDRYQNKIAYAINRSNQIECMCPSIMICGAGNFPVKKKEKQNKARENFWEEYSELFTSDNYYMRKIESLLSNKTIYSSDALAIEKLESKITDLQQTQSLMKEVNAFYRKNKTLNGCNLLTEDEIEKLKLNMNYHSWYDVPYPSCELTKNNANIKKLQQRVDEIKKLKEHAEKPVEKNYPKVDGIKIEEDANDMRIRLYFDDMPSVQIREILKHWGFKWSPSNSAWQRQLTINGVYGTKRALRQIIELEGNSNE